MSFRVAIVGRPNVGKSTLFNRLAGRKMAIVDDTPGVTRDRREAEASLGDLDFTVIDTAGLEEAAPKTLENRMRKQTEQAVREATVALFLIDARAGVTALDKHFASWLRSTGKPIVLVANKCEGKAGQSGLGEAFGLGLGEPIPVSAEHGEGLSDLFDVLRSHAPSADAKDADAAPEDDENKPLQLAIIGRPNVGKSTLINRLLGEERMLTGPEAGITRDAIAIDWQWKGTPIRLIDTAGMRRKANVVEKIEYMSVGETLRAVRFADVVVLVLDGEMMLEKQDLALARMVVEEGRALVIGVNKWDAVKDKKQAVKKLTDRLEASLAQIRGIPIAVFSAGTGQGVDKLMPTVLEAYKLWNTRISTGALNRWLEPIVEDHPPPLNKGRRIKIRYMTQVKARPPTFAIFASQPEAMPESYLRYLVNGLRQRFGLEGVPIRMLMRGQKNPYVDDKD
ncbi:MAG: der [Alphaproteobacteria bacterium]|nr:der [Alphaproteobacteria bacterium]